MDLIQKAIAAFKAQELGDKTSYTSIAAKYGVDRSTLSRRHQGSQASKDTIIANGRALNPQQELELVRYIEGLTKQGLPPTREMVQNFGSAIAHRQLSESWVTRFLSRHDIDLILKWTAGIDRVRHQADSGYKYKLYFSLLHKKMEEYIILPADTYNMDEKGFMIGVIGRSKRVFSKRMWVKKEVRAAIQDGNREWITVLACVCADGSALPPSLIFAAANGNIRDTWVEAIEAGEHSVHVSSSPSGWTNDEIAMAWLEQVFDRHTKGKSGRYRLLILDGHGSHISTKFIEYCHRNRILLSIFPPHSTHTLQPLDVVMFKPLSSAYSKELAYHQHQALGLNPIKKGDFFPLFWSAWMSSFKETTIRKSFEACGIWPMDASPVLNKFSKTTDRSDDDRSSSSRLSPTDWIHMERLVRAAVKDTYDKESQKLSRLVHRLSAQNGLLLHENAGLKEALKPKKKRKKHGKALDFEQSKLANGGAVFYSPSTIRVARDLAEIKEREEEEKQLQKLRKKKEKEEARLLKQLENGKKREERERAKVVREKERAEKAAQRAEKAAQRAAQNTKKTASKPHTTKRKASKAPLSSNKRQKQVSGGAAPAEAQDVLSVLPSKVTSRGRNVNLPSKFR
jgi:hypothetical protein